MEHEPKIVVQVTDVTCGGYQEGEFNLNVRIGRKPCRFLIDTGANISIIKKGISHKLIRKCSVEAKSVTGNELRVYGMQKLSLCIGNFLVYYHDFLVADLQTDYDGVIGLDLLRRLKAVLDFSKGDMYIDNEVIHLTDKEPTQTGKDEAGQLVSSVQSPVSETQESSREHIWNVVAVRNESIPPASEVLVRGRLNARALQGVGSQPMTVTREPSEVLIEPVETKIHGIRVARVLSKVTTSVGHSNLEVVLQLINYSKEPLEVPKNSLLGIAEVFETKVIGDSLPKDTTGVSDFRNVKGKSHRVNYVAKQSSLSTDYELKAEIQGKLEHLSYSEQKILQPVLLEYKHLFTDPVDQSGCKINIRHKIDTGDNPPIRKNPYRLPHALKPVVNTQIQDMHQKGIIRESDSPWGSPVVIVSKKSLDGTPKYRFCVDYRALNAITRGDAYPLPNITETLDSLNGSQFFTTLDLCSGYHQVRMEPTDIEKTAFTLPGHHCEFVRMPFGLCNAPATFQRLMDTVLLGIKGESALVYLDDIIVYSSTLDQHAERLRNVLERLNCANLYVQLPKCTFAVREVEYLGHIVSGDGVKPDPKKIAAVANYPRPQNARDVRAFLGLVGYYRKFIKDFAGRTKPLTELLKKDSRFEWAKSQEIAFKDLTKALCHKPVLRYPDFSKPFIVSTDASGTAIGAVLAQSHNGNEHPIAYASRQLNKAEKNYGATERELLALVWATKYFRCYLYGRKFTAVTDHSALRWMLSLRDPSSRLTRWALRLSEFDYNVVHKPGKKHANADALSRHVNAIVTPLLSKQDVKNKQTQDDFCLKQQRNVPNNKYTTDDEGLLYNLESSVPRLVIPRALVQQVIEQHHDTLFSGHQGVKKTIGVLKQRYYWPTLTKDVEDYISKCVSCNQRKATKQARAPLGRIQPATKPFELVSLDIVGPLPVTTSGHRYLLTFMDYLTRYCEAIPIPNQTAETVAREFVQKIITRYGVPSKLLTDQGRNFVSALFKGVCTLLGVQKLQTTPYHPQCNGMVERLHRSLADMISHFVSSDGKNWDTVVPYALMAYRSAPHTATGYSPHLLLFGEEMNLPSSDNLAMEPQVEENVQLELGRLKEKLHQVRDIAIQRSEQSKRKSKEHYDKRARFKPYRVGQFVYLHDPALKRGPRKKFTKSWKGPYEIVDVINDLNYKIEIKTNEFLIVHFNRLKPSKATTRKTRRVIKTSLRSDNTPNDIDPERQDLVTDLSDVPAPQIFPESVITTANYSNSESEMDDLNRTVPMEITEVNEPSDDEEMALEPNIHIDPRDPEWRPPPTLRANPEVQSQYNLRPRDQIVAPRRSFSD